MGKNYQALKKELAERLIRNPVRDLLVVNDHLIRQKYFAEANDIIHKIEKIEKKIQLFHSSDQKRFDDWYKLTFRENQLSIERARQEFRKLAEFHNWVIATARMLDIELADALVLMQEEERRYQTGSEEERRKIELDREKRNAFIEADSGPKYDEEINHGREDSGDESNPMDAVIDRIEEILLPQDREILSAQEHRVERIFGVQKEMMELALADQETAFLLFHLGLSWGERKGDFSYFVKMWKLFSREQKIFFSEVFQSITGQSIKYLLRKIDKNLDLDYDEEEPSSHSEEEDEDEEASQFNDEFIGRKGAAKKSSKFNPLEEEKFKQLYRKLIRQLHPDAHASEKPQGWMKRFWDSAQKAYQSKDLSALDRILKLTLLRTNSLDQLTVDEICQAKNWLEKDLSSLEGEAGQLKRSMAWGFSERKDYSTLTRKIRKEFDESLNTVLFEIKEIQRQHQILESMAANEGLTEEKVYRKKKTQKNQARRRRRPRRRQSEDDNQESFSF